MNASIEYIAAGMIMMMVLGVTGMFTSNMVNERISNIEQISGIKISDRIVDALLLSSGDPADWGSRVYAPQSIGFALQNAIKPYQLDREKVSCLLNSSRNYIPPSEVRDLIGLAKNYYYSLKIYSLYNITITKLTSESYLIKVTNQWNTSVPSINIIGAYTNAVNITSIDLLSFRNGDLEEAVYQYNSTDLSGQCILKFIGSGQRNTLLVMANQLNIKSINMWPKASDYLITSIESTMGVTQNAAVEIVYRSVEIDGLNYYCKLTMWWT
jgi:hypothetical protein